MTFGMFILGALVMGIGFTMVWRTNVWTDFFGSLDYAVGVSWITWKSLGIFLMFVGFLLAFGLIGLFLQRIFGNGFSFGVTPQ